MAVSDEFTRWETLIRESKDRTPLWQAQVATCMHFNAGNHRIWFDERGMQRERKIHDNEVWRTVNKFPSTLSRIAARMTANQPRWNPVPSELEDVTDDEIDAADAVLQDLWEGDENGDNALRVAAKFVARQAFLQGRYLTYYTFDHETNMPEMQCFSLWDVFSDSPEKLKDKQWLIIALPTPVEQIKTNSDYDQAERVKATADGRLAQNMLQDQFKRKKTGAAGTKKDQTQIVLHVWEVVQKDGEERAGKDDESEQEAKKRISNKKNVIKYKVVIDQGVLMEKELDYPRLSVIFDSYAPTEDGIFYTRPLAADWIDPQKSINKINSSIEAYIDNFLQGKWIIRDDTVTIPVAGRMGQKLKDPSGSGVTNLPLQPLPQTHFQYEQSMQRNFEQASGVSEGSIANVSGIGDSGKAIAQLQAIDELSTSDPLDNFSLFLSRSAKKLLRQASDNWSDVKILYRFDKGERRNQEVRIIGSKFRDSEDASQEGVTSLRPFKRIDVEIEVGAFFRKSQVRQSIKELFQMGWQPGANPIIDMAVFNNWNIGHERELMRELKKLQNPHALIAEGNAKLIQEGNEVPINGTDPHTFYSGFYAAKAEELLKGGNQRGATLLNAQSQRHRIIAQQSGGGAGSPEVPETLDELEIGQGE